MTSATPTTSTAIGPNASEGRWKPRFALDKGPISEVHAFWLAGMSCDGCSIAAVGAQNPTVEQLLTAAIFRLVFRGGSAGSRGAQSH